VLRDEEDAKISIKAFDLKLKQIFCVNQN